MTLNVPTLLDVRLPHTDPATSANLASTLPTITHMLLARNVSRAHQGVLLSLHPRTITRALAGRAPTSLNQDQITRASYLTHIMITLGRLYADPTAIHWLHSVNLRHPFTGTSPLAYALEHGIPGLMNIHTLLLMDLTDYPTTTPEQRAAAQDFTLTINADLSRYHTPQPATPQPAGKVTMQPVAQKAAQTDPTTSINASINASKTARASTARAKADAAGKQTAARAARPSTRDNA